ncbi:MAG TPA: hypothetical protein VMT44_03685 [Methanoregula sp.]|nr:hypothetical protein [Methanoregula sp.]
MKLSHLGLIVVMIVMIGVAFSGCTSSSPSTTAATGSPSGTSGAQAPQPPGAATTAAVSSGSSGGVSGANLFSGLSYNWVEYKMAAQGMTIYMKFEKSGKCTMRFEGAAAAQMPNGGTMDCSSTGKAQSNPNQVASDAQVSCSGTESVTVPAGTFDATKCTVTSKGVSSTMWVVPGKYLAKMESPGGTLVLNAFG